jgi:hypothetical protein
MNTQGKNCITNTWASTIKTLTSISLFSPPIPLPEKNKCFENPISSADNSCVNNLMNCEALEEQTMYQEMLCNVAECNEPARCNLRSSRQKKPSEKKDDFLWYENTKDVRIFRI